MTGKSMCYYLLNHSKIGMCCLCVRNPVFCSARTQLVAFLIPSLCERNLRTENTWRLTNNS